jgi:hypothetical protein
LATLSTSSTRRSGRRSARMTPGTPPPVPTSSSLSPRARCGAMATASAQLMAKAA